MTEVPPEGFAAAVDATAHVFADALDDRITIVGDDGHHLQRVRRVGVGEHVTVADGRGTWRAYAVVATPRSALELEAIAVAHVEPPVTAPIAVAFAPTKGDGSERVVAGCTELGVDEFVPVLTARTVVRAASMKSPQFLARLRRVAREAAMQSRRARLPVVQPVTEFATIAARTDLVVGVPGGPTAPPSDREVAGGCVLVGPEGGFTGEESELLAGAAAVGVGPHVLRATTAAVAVAAVVVSHCRPPRDYH